MSGEGAPDQADLPGDLRGQAELFGGPIDGHAVRRRTRRESPVVDADEAEIERVFGRGRPKGATNIATAKRLEMYARVSGDPLLASARIQAMPTSELMIMLGCTALEAERFRQAERFQAMPYVISKRPVDVNLNDKSPPALHLHFGAAMAAPGAALPLGAGGAVALLEQHRKAIQGEILPPIETLEETEA